MPSVKHIRRLRSCAAQLVQLADEFDAMRDKATTDGDSLMFGAARISNALERELLIDRVELEYSNRRRRRNFFDAEVFGEPGWDILLDLFAACLKGRSISITSACIAGDVPATTGLRWLTHLEQLGLLERSDNPNDLRSSWIKLTEKAETGMKGYFESAFSQSEKAQRFYEEKIIEAGERVRL